MWGKREQTVLWGTAYLPLYLIMIYRFIDSNDFFKKTYLALWLSKHINKVLFDFIIIVLIIIFSLLIYRSVTNWYFKDFEKELTQQGAGATYAVRKYEKLSVNDYSFFLITLLLPLVSLDYASVINLTVSLLIIIVVIAIYVKTDFISVCPLFFTSGRHVFKAIISTSSQEEEAMNPSLKISAIIITKEKNLNLNNKFKAEKLVSNIYYLAVNRNHD
ncbi:hypothetical protein PP175_01520 [Aneurinibacillus sp. Ricciae_BoGa-3]|uniref:hypothetical protein n=1 Tax=Aneurinibacillus sp. Ricciae_BoGa-3 TaxID=3022697 RepID=UPI002340DB63|nr:hypothetical protein [Aneurinibacillus sp. Ricciae_BoGa-3]WCK54744.1 hypothetical protein PP175_01520 [Aneurinibacillus sp. Ricciae_BoGa-3]